MNKISLNARVRVKLTEHGLALLSAHIENTDFGKNEELRVFMREYNQADVDGCHNMILWQLMSIFGKDMYNGAKNIFEENNMFLSEVL